MFTFAAHEDLRSVNWQQLISGLVQEVVLKRNACVLYVRKHFKISKAKWPEIANPEEAVRFKNSVECKSAGLITVEQSYPSEKSALQIQLQAECAGN